MDIDIDELVLLKGKPILSSVGEIYQPTIDDITYIGEKKYNKHLGVISISKDLLIGKENDELQNINNYDIIRQLCLEDRSFYGRFVESIEFFIKQKIEISTSGFVVGDNDVNVINANNYDEIIYIIKLQNCMVKLQQYSENPSSHRAKELLEKRKKAREKIAKIKNKGEDDGEPLTMADLVSILCANGNGINHDNVWRMPIYMFNNQFNRMRMLENYDINIRSLLAGAKSEDIELEHWMSKIK